MADTGEAHKQSDKELDRGVEARQRRAEAALVAFADGRADLSQLLPGWRVSPSAQGLRRRI